ncbi:MAG: cell wall metabolism sensor histidine kinase WalK, partial [Anaerolineae bacterium]|nr:cell wall metabolism sensor histidine kinase WalK [Anaerolineae bacterium]
QQRVFERFYQVERARSGLARGTGLGLAIARQAVRAHSGTIVIESAVGQGTTFTLTLPMVEVRARG